MPVTDTSLAPIENVSYSINEKSFSTKSPIIFRIFTNEAKGVLRHGKIFEDYFSEYQADMVSICLEYVDWRADAIYIYCSYESNTIYGDCFFEITKKVVKKHQLNDIKGKEEGFEYDVSEERQKALLNIILENIKKITKSSSN